MKPSKPLKNQTIDGSKPTDWFSFITGDDHFKLVIPVGPRFQSEVPPWSPPAPRLRCLTQSDANSKWIGTQIWPPKGSSQDTCNVVIGRGRSGSCACEYPGSVKCVKKHVADKRCRLQVDLGPAFWKWKFDEMGESVSNLWSLKEEKKFECIAKMKATSTSLIKTAQECFPGHSKRSIVSYYLNVYTPRRIGVETRSHCMNVDTDDEGDDTPCLKRSRKRLQADSFDSYRCKYVRNTYLTARR